MHISFHWTSLKNKINQERLLTVARIYTRRRRSTLVQTQTEKWLSVSAGDVMRAATAPGRLLDRSPAPETPLLQLRSQDTQTSVCPPAGQLHGAIYLITSHKRQ